MAGSRSLCSAALAVLLAAAAAAGAPRKAAGDRNAPLPAFTVLAVRSRTTTVGHIMRRTSPDRPVRIGTLRVRVGRRVAVWPVELYRMDTDGSIKCVVRRVRTSDWHISQEAAMTLVDLGQDLQGGLARRVSIRILRTDVDPWPRGFWIGSSRQREGLLGPRASSAPTPIWERKVRRGRVRDRTSPGRTPHRWRRRPQTSLSARVTLLNRVLALPGHRCLAVVGAPRRHRASVTRPNARGIMQQA